MFFCPECSEEVSEEEVVGNHFCPNCGSLLEKKRTYDIWKPPQPITIYCKKNNVSYKQAKYQKEVNP